MQFYPTPDHDAHADLENRVCELCEERGFGVIDVPQYYMLPDNEKLLYAEIFTPETLFIRSHPDKLVLGNPVFFLDFKTTVRRDTGNMAIELSSFYYNLQCIKSGIKTYYCYADSEPMAFSPGDVKPACFILQPKWENPVRKLFLVHIREIQEYFGIKTDEFYEYETAGSQDPFILLNYDDVKRHSRRLTSLLTSTKPIKGDTKLKKPRKISEGVSLSDFAGL